MQQPNGAKPSHTPWLIVGLVVVGIVLVTAYLQRPKTTGAGDGASPQVSSDADMSPSTPSVRRPRPTVRAAAPAEAIAAQREATAQKRKEAQAKVDRTQASFAARYQNEPVDAAWASAKEAQLAKLATSDQIRQIGVEARNLNVDCKSSMCRVTGDFDSMGAGDDWFTLYMNNVAEQVPVASYKYIRNPDGTVKINVYAVGRR
jgi:hypothetical protein